MEEKFNNNENEKEFEDISSIPPSFIIALNEVWSEIFSAKHLMLFYRDFYNFPIDFSD